MNTLVIGLTGPTGSGKSTVAGIFRDWGIPVIDADIVSREAVEPGQPALLELNKAFSDDIIAKDGSLNRSELARRAFSSEDNVRLLNSIVHPFVMERIEDTLAELRASGARVVLLDAPLLYEAGAERLCNRALAVLAPFNVRLSRIMTRDGITEEDARLRMNAGKDDEYYKARANDIIYNTGDEKMLRQDTKVFIKKLF